MATDSFVYKRGAELPGLTLPWQEETAQGVFADLDLTSGWSFTLRLINRATQQVAVTKTTGITGFDGGVVVTWATDELDIPAGVYRLRLRARENATSRDRDYSPASPPTIQIVEEAA